MNLAVFLSKVMVAQGFLRTTPIHLVTPRQAWSSTVQRRWQPGQKKVAG